MLEVIEDTIDSAIESVEKSESKKDEIEEKPEEAAELEEPETAPEGDKNMDEKEELSLADIESAPDIELEKNDSETVEIGSKDGSVEHRPNISSSPTEELTAIPPPRGEENQTPTWSPAPRTPGAFRIPEYRWSAQHYRILTELLNELDDDLNAVHADPILCTTIENQDRIAKVLTPKCNNEK